jgi:hypothetical protein
VNVTRKTGGSMDRGVILFLIILGIQGCRFRYHLDKARARKEKKHAPNARMNGKGVDSENKR